MDQVKLKESRQQFVVAKKERRLLVHEEQFDAADEQIKSASKRAELFADWIQSTYGLEYLEGRTVLDIAGGRGDLAFELAIKSGLDCQVSYCSY